MNGGYRYRTLFTGTLVQESALSVSGSDPDLSPVDSPLARDGLGRFVLRGQSLGGALVAAARKLGKVPADVSGYGRPRGSPEPSRWHVFASHPVGRPRPEFRPHVGIRQDTGAAAEGVYFDVEVLPNGVRWPFLMEVNTSESGGAVAERLAAAALLEWTRGRCFLGREVARGLGWLRLEDLRARRLGTEHAGDWPDSTDEPLNVVQRLNVQTISARDFVHVFGELPVSGAWYYVELEGRIRAGERDDGYGVDALSVGGHAVASEIPWDGHFIAPQGRHPHHTATAFDTDMMPVLTMTDSGPVPFLPGSSLRGPLRHAFSRALRQGGYPIRDPNVEKKPQIFDAGDALFGSTGRSARLLVRDSHLVGENWKAALLQHHAEDEFAGGVFESSKFNRVVLIGGEFAWRMVLEIERVGWDLLQKQMGALRRALGQLGKARRLAIGGAKWRSAGWPEWTVTEARAAPAGKDADVWY